MGEEGKEGKEGSTSTPCERDAAKGSARASRAAKGVQGGALVSSLGHESNTSPLVSLRTVNARCRQQEKLEAGEAGEEGEAHRGAVLSGLPDQQPSPSSRDEGSKRGRRSPGKSSKVGGMTLSRIRTELLMQMRATAWSTPASLFAHVDQSDVDLSRDGHIRYDGLWSKKE